MADGTKERPPATVSCSCSFYDPRKDIVVQLPIKVATGLGAAMVSIRHAAQDYADDNRFEHFAIPATLDPAAGEKWLVFYMQGRMAHFLKAWPNRSSAEMWMQHNGNA